MIDILIDTLIDSLRIIPFLFVTYIIMEYIEHKMSDRTREMVRASGKYGPIIGSAAGIFPQCGFSAAAANLYSGRVITVGTLMAIFLSTSDEMIPVFLSQKAPIGLLVKVLVLKLIIGMAVGLLIDFVWRRQHSGTPEEMHITHVCEHEHCHCENGIFKSALYHTIKISIFIFIVSFCLNLIIDMYGQDNLARLILNQPFFGSAIAGLVGLIPNCAASVVVAQLYLEGAMTFGAMMSGLLAAAGVGLIVLYRMNDSVKENLKITGLLFSVSVVVGWLIDILGIF